MNYHSSYYSFLYDGSQDANLRAEFVATLVRNEKFSILEAHAGDGLLSMNLSSKGYHVTALEEDPVLFAILLEKFRLRRDLNPFLSPLPLNFLSLDSSNTWDLVLFSNAISFIDDKTLNLYLAKAHALLGGGGLLVINSPQRTSLRKEQPLSEIHKKIFGNNTIRQLASSVFLDDGMMRVNYLYEVYAKDRLMIALKSQHDLRLRDPKSLVEVIEENNFHVERITTGWTDSPLDPDCPNYVVIARKHSSGFYTHG